MKLALLISFVLCGFAVLAGCGSTGVLPLGNNLYLIDAQGGSALQSAGRSKRNALQDANGYCLENSLMLNVVRMKAYDGVPGTLLPHTELIFECIRSGEEGRSAFSPDVKIQLEEIP